MRGAEVFFVGRLNHELIVVEVEAYAFGNRRTVPALIQYARPGEVIIHNHPSGNLEPSGPDIEISSTLGERGIGSYIINNDCTEIRPVVKPVRLRKIEPLDAESLAKSLSPGGALAQTLEGYEFRPQQIEMLDAVAEALNQDGIAAIEAGTGTGKSMAYLLPALAWSLKNQEKVVVSTHTINLQEQLIEKDLPLLKNALKMDFEAVLVKGRNNYLCKRKAEYVLHHPDFFETPEKQLQLDAIQTWIKTTRDGSLSDLGFTPDTDVWEKVMSETDNCLRTQCPHYQSCFFYTARRRAARAQLLIANHHLLMADLALRAETGNYTQAAVLPPFHRVVIDEAHHLEEVATTYFGSRVSRGGMIFLLRRLSSPKTGAGLLHYLSQRIHDGTYTLGPDRANEWLRKLMLDFMEMHRELHDAIEEASDRTAMALDEREGGALDRRLEMKLRITSAMADSNFWTEEIAPLLKAILTAARPYIENLRFLHQTLYATVENETPELMSPLLELKSAVLKIEQQMSQLIRFLGGTEGDCRWIEYRRRGDGKHPLLAFCSAPLKIADELREKVLRRYRTVVMTSATLTVERNFDFFLSQIGAENPNRLGFIGSQTSGGTGVAPASSARRLETLLLETPFEFDRQVYVGVPLDLPSPKENERHAPALGEFLTHSLRISRGRALVLFTSHALLEKTFQEVAPALEAEGYPCLKQGSAGRTLLTEAFRRDVGSVLFATSSFWEGVDVVGEALSCLVLTRLPFSVPGEPILDARIEAMKEAGIDPFEHFIVPRAVIRFRQGFGRLIRSREDRGAVLICDRRAATASYGQTFLRSLPTKNIHIATASDVFDRLRSFFAME